MNLVILGAGQVGASLAELLSDDKNDVTLVDINSEKLQALQDKLDIRTVIGHASSPSVLARAGLEFADLLIATTASDEINITACQIAWALFKTETKIARVRNQDYLEHPELFTLEDNEEDRQAALPIDVLISPEQLVTDHLLQLIEYPGALQVVDFAQGLVRLVALKATKYGALTGKKISEIKSYIPQKIGFRLVAIYRQDEVVIPKGDVTVQVGDEVFLLAETNNISYLVDEFRRSKTKKSRSIMIAGGGKIGLRLAKQLEQNYRVKVLDNQIRRARKIAEQLEKSIIIHGNTTDRDLLLEENIDETDMFIAATNSDEANIISSMLAKKLGAKRVIALINNNSYLDLIHLNSIDVAVSADRITTDSFLRYVREEETIKASTLRRGAAEAIELEVAHNSALVGELISNYPWPEGVTLGCILRQKQVLFETENLVFAPEDHVIIFLTDRKVIDEVGVLFSVSTKTWW